uniref:hypothetical protein n=1 Tax=Clostridium sp. NkU-1 TaxID=1095009 RepID=UPI000B092DF3
MSTGSFSAFCDSAGTAVGALVVSEMFLELHPHKERTAQAANSSWIDFFHSILLFMLFD